MFIAGDDKITIAFDMIQTQLLVQLLRGVIDLPESNLLQRQVAYSMWMALIDACVLDGKVDIDDLGILEPPDEPEDV